MLLVTALLLGLSSQHHNRISATKDSITGSFVGLPGVVEMGEAVEKGVGIDDNRLSHCERRLPPQSEGQVRDEAVESNLRWHPVIRFVMAR